MPNQNPTTILIAIDASAALKAAKKVQDAIVDLQVELLQLPVTATPKLENRMDDPAAVESAINTIIAADLDERLDTLSELEKKLGGGK